MQMNRNGSKSSLDNMLDLTPFIDDDQPLPLNYLRRNSISMPALAKLELDHLQEFHEPIDEVSGCRIIIP